jgi:hypothetical protein
MLNSGHFSFCAAGRVMRLVHVVRLVHVMRSLFGTCPLASCACVMCPLASCALCTKEKQVLKDQTWQRYIAITLPRQEKKLRKIKLMPKNIIKSIT